MRRAVFFLRLFSWFSGRQLRLQPWRVVAVLAGIGLGAAVFTSVRLAVDASLDAFHQSMEFFSGKAHWTVISRDGRVPEGILAAIVNHPGVEAASPLITRYVRAEGRELEPFLFIGLDPLLDRPFRDWAAESTQREETQPWLDLIRFPDTLLVSGKLARDMALAKDGLLRLEGSRRPVDFRVLGELESGGIAAVEGGRVAIADISTVQEFIGLTGWVDRIDIRLRSGTSGDVASQLQGLLPPGLTLASPSESKETGDSMIRAYQINLSLLSFVSLFVGMFLIYSLVSFNASARRRELAVLCSLGASSRLIFLLILSEGGLLGILGWVAAIPLGSVLTSHLVRGVSDTVNNLFVRVHVEGLTLDTGELILSFAVTLLVSLLAALRPARQAVGISPKEAMASHAFLSSPRAGVAGGPLAGFLMIALAFLISRLPPVSGVPLAGYGSVLAMVVGFSLFSPPLLHVIGVYLPRPLRRFFGEPAFLAARFVGDARDRTTISVGALITAVALFASLVIMVHSFRGTVSLWVNQTLEGDLFARPKMAGLNQYRDPIPEPAEAWLKEVSEETELMPYRRLFLSDGGMPYQLEATCLDVFLRYGRFFFLNGDPDRIAAPLLAGEGVIVSEVFSVRSGLTTGDRFRADLGNARLDLPILGVFRDYRTRGGVVIMELGAFQEITRDRSWGGAVFFFKDRRQDLEAAAERLLARIANGLGTDNPLEMAPGAKLRREVMQIFDETFAVTTVLLIIALVVAGLGIATTLSVLVMERMRQINTLVAVGASLRQVRSMIFWEAVFLVAVGQGIGIVCGFFMSYILIYVINLQSFGWTFLYRVDWNALLTAVPLILAAALAAALPAVRLVVRSSPALVLREQ